eukprot:Skav212941  [mRNA]  locus=scaffold374:493277:494851:- [translate_table: standard]
MCAMGLAQHTSLQLTVLRSGGLNLRADYEMALQGHWELRLDDLTSWNETNKTRGCFKVSKDLNFTFREGNKYSFEISIDGVKAIGEPFSVKLFGKDPVDVIFNWLMSALAGLLGVILLVSNMMKRHWCWLIFAALGAVGLTIALPWMTLHQDAMYGAWLWVAVGNLVLIYLALAWATTAQRGNLVATFAAKRASIFEEYSDRKMQQLLLCLPKASHYARQRACGCFRSFNSEDAFFFPSAFLLANFLSFLSFIYVLFQSIQVLNGLQDMLQKVLNSAVDASITLGSTINSAYFQATDADLPDGALAD